MPFGAYVETAEKTYAEIEALIAQIEAGEISVAIQQERALRSIFSTLQYSVKYRLYAGLRQINYADPATAAATRTAFAQLEQWVAGSTAAFRAQNLHLLRAGKQPLAEMKYILNQAARDWKTLASRAANPAKFTPAQVLQANRLIADTHRLEEKFGGFDSWLQDVTGEASFGKAENFIALINQANRDGQNAISRIMKGPGGTGPGTATGLAAGSRTQDRIDRYAFGLSGPAGVPNAPAVFPEYPVGGIDPAFEATDLDIADQARTIKFDRRRLVLTATAHARGLYNTTMIKIAEALGVNHFMYFLPKGSTRKAAKGISRQELYQIRLGEPDARGQDLDGLTEAVAAVLRVTPQEALEEANRRAKLADAAAARAAEGDGRQPPPPTAGTPEATREALAKMQRAEDPNQTWQQVYARVNRGRRSTVPFATSLGIHPGSQEYYLPVPATLIHEARAWANSRRRRLAPKRAA